MIHPSYEASVVIPVYNGADVLLKQLKALDKQGGNHSFEVIVSDNGSTDNTREVVESYQASYPLRIVDSSERAGICTARNLGVMAAQGDIILFCDADDFVEPGWISGHLAVHTQHSPAIVAGSLLHGHNPPQVLRAYGLIPGLDEDIRTNPTLVKTAEDMSVSFLPSVAGCNFSVPRSVYLKLGGMDTTYLGGSEETDFTWRAQLAGIPFFQTNSALVNYTLRTTPRGIYQQLKGYQSTRVLLWKRFKDQGFTAGPSLSYSLKMVLKSLPQLLVPRLRLSASYQLGGNIGALIGMVRYRLGSIPPRQLMK